MNRLYTLALALTSTLLLPAQTGTASFSGTITDPNGLPLPGAAIRIESPDNGFNLAAQTAADGIFRFPSLAPGPYTVTIQAEKFAPRVMKNFVLSSSEVVNQSIPLSLETVSTQIEVMATASGIRVQTAEAQITRVLTPKELELLPQIGRSPTQLILYAPGVLYDAGYSRINGTRNTSTNTKQDGITVNDSVYPRFGLNSTFPNLDSLSEVRIILNGGKAEYGRNAGGQVELVTKRGSNRWSGNLYEFHRNTVLNANNFFNNTIGLPRPKYIQNTFGGSLGGPIRKNRTFFFLNAQSPITAQDVQRNRTVLTDSARVGIFQWRAPGSATIQAFDIVRNDPRRLGIDPDMARKIKLLPPANNTQVGDGLNTAGYLFNNPTNSSNPSGTARLDHQLSTAHRLFFRYVQTYLSLIDADSPYPGIEPGHQNAATLAFSAGSDWTLSPAMINEVRFGLTRYHVIFDRPRLKGPVAFPGSFFNPDFTATNSDRAVPGWDFNDSLTWIKNQHTLKAGISFQRQIESLTSEGGIYPNLIISRNFNNLPPATIGPNGAAIALADRTRFENLYNDLFGRVSNINQNFISDLRTYSPAGTPRSRDFRSHDWGMFFQDDWKVNRKLMLNIGLRYELFQSPVEQNGLMGSLDRPGATLGFTPITSLTIQRVSRYLPPDHNNFAPRFGFAYDPSGNGKTAIRGSFGVFYERGANGILEQIDANTPGFLFGGQSFPNTAAGSDVRISDRPAAPTAPASVDLTLPVTRSTAMLLVSPALPRPYFLHANLTIQREIGRGTVIEAGYVGTRGIKLSQFVNVNEKDLRGSGFLADFVQLQDFVSRGTAVPPSNAMVRMFGSAQAAVANLGATSIVQGAAGTVADTLDRNFYTRYAAAGLPQTYLRLFPQFNNLYTLESSARSYFDSLQLSIRRDSGWLRTAVNYMWSKNIDTIFGDNGDGNDNPSDRFDFRLSRGLSAYHIPHSMNMTATAQLPFGTGRRFGQGAPGWLNTIAGGWDLGVLARVQSGYSLSVGSAVSTYGGSTNYANYSGPRIGSVQKLGDRVTYFTPEEVSRFSIPAAGQRGTLGKFFFQRPDDSNIDVSISKTFRLHEGHRIAARFEAYNLLNHAVFGLPATDLLTPQTFGRFSGTTNSPRNLQVALRYDF